MIPKYTESTVLFVNELKGGARATFIGLAHRFSRWQKAVMAVIRRCRKAYWAIQRALWVVEQWRYVIVITNKEGGIHDVYHAWSKRSAREEARKAVDGERHMFKVWFR